MLDWELASQGHPAADLGYVKPFVCRMLPWPDFVHHYQQAGGWKVEPRELRFHTIYNAVRLYGLIMQARAPMKREYKFAIDLPGEGFIGVGDVVPGKSDVEIGYWIGKPYWGRGLGGEVACALANFAAALNAGPVIAYHFVDNPSSGRVLEKAGFDYTGETHDLFSLARGGMVASRCMVHRRACAQAA